MSKSNSRILIAVLTLMMAVFAFPVCVSADSGGFTTPAFDVSVVTDEDHVFHVSEEIHVDFNTPRHGIYRYIPEGGRYYDVQNIHVQGDDYSIYAESGNEVVQIGSADYYVQGPHIYRITYDLVCYRDDDTAKDMLSLDLLPTGWSTPIESATLTVQFPKKTGDITVYSGQYGEQNQDGYFRINRTDNTLTAVSRTTLPQGMGLTISADLPEGYWVNPISRDDMLPAMYGILGVMGMLMLLLWFFIGRDDPVIPTIGFYPPDDMDPLEVAYVGNDEVQQKEISALFMYLANKGYIDIESTNRKAFKLIRKGDMNLSERAHTRKLFNAMFSRGKEVRTDNLPARFGEAAAKVESEVRESVNNRKQTFSTVSLAGRALGLAFCFLIPLIAGVEYSYLTFWDNLTVLLMSIVFAVVIFLAMSSVVAKTDAFRVKKRPVRIIIGFIVFLLAAGLEASIIVVDYPILAGVFAASILAAAVATIFVRRRMNNELFGRVLGFRDFIRTAEYDRLKMLSEENPEYYFNIMPYAYVFGMSTKWADKFADFKIQNPSWYISQNGTWDPYFPHHMFIYSNSGISSCVADHYKAVGAGMLSNAVDSASSFGGGGFGGGGFSGGGFGGGGGGSW